MRGFVALLATVAGVAHSEPWINPGDVTLRHDLQRLADAGLLTGPMLSWPIGWLQVTRELARIDPQRLGPGEQDAVERLRSRALREMRTHDVRLEASVSGATNPTPLRTFDDIPREEAELSLGAAWIGERFAWKLAGTVVADPDDEQEFRADGSYVTGSLGNWMFSAGYLDRWWGPGWQGSLILSSNARPMLTIALDRNEATPFDLPILRWLGPWRFSTLMSQFEHDRDYPYALLFGLRAEIRPHPTLQLAVSRTAQWCGEGRPCGFDTFWDMLAGNDNDQPPEEQPGNQLGGFDARWSWPGGRVPIALYAQGIGEDEAGFLPSKYLGLFGAEVWGDLGHGSWRAHVEYADTACDFPADPPEFGCAYTNSIYTTGYRYLGRVLGHTADADSESIGGGLLYVDGRGRRWDALVRSMKLNRAGASPGSTLADAPGKVQDVALSHESEHSWGTISVSLGYADVDASGTVAVDDGWRGFLNWRCEVR